MLSTLLNQIKLDFEPFEQSNMHSTLDFCLRPARKETSVKFIYSKKATKFGKIFTLLLSYVVPFKSKVKISQNFVDFSEYMNFTST